MAKHTERRFRFALRNGKTIDVSDVESGLACNCICSACGHPLQAKKGKKNVHHFAHDPMAKEILKEDGFLIFPALTIEQSADDQIGMRHTEEVQIETGGKKLFECVELEERLGDIRPDIVAYFEGGPLIIEVAVTSFAKRVKKRIIRDLGLPAIEIDLSSVDYSTTKSELRNLMHSDLTDKSWLSNPKAIEARKKLIASLQAKIQQINSAYRRNTRSSTEQASDALPVREAVTLSYTKIHPTDSAEDTRWFCCESCSSVFELPLSAVPASSRSVTCPDCDQAVSTDSRRAWQ